MENSPYFVYDQRVALIIGCIKYDKLRTSEGKSKFSDLAEVEEDIINVTDGLKRLGFKDDEMQVLRDPSFDDCQQLFLKTNLNMSNARRENKKTLIFLYYAGHGAMKETT